MEYKKIGNRYYKIEDDMIIKATYNDIEDYYTICGEYIIIDFLNHNEIYDGNTENHYKNIIKSLKL